MNELQEWKKITFNFVDKSIWNKRKMCLEIQTDSEFEFYLLSLKNKNNGEKDIFFLKTLLEINRIKPEINVGFESTEIPNPRNFAISCISDYLFDHYIKSFEKCLSFKISESEKIVNQVYCQIQNKIFSFINPTIEYEYKTYLLAYKKNDNYSSHKFFIEQMTNSEEWILYYFESYPVLLSILASFSDFFKIDVERTFSRLNNDLDEIKDIFNIEFLGEPKLQEIHLFMGDPHKGWQTTTLFKFCDRYNKIHDVYYKPKNLSGDIYFNNFVNFIHSLGLKKSILATKCINKHTYGWQKGVCYTEFRDQNKLPEFFYLQGVNLAIAYILNIQDLIADNIIVSNNFPVYFDLEMIFVPQFKEGQDYRTKSTAGRNFLTGVIKTGLIPSFGFETANNAGYSNSGISKISNNFYNIVVVKNAAAALETMQVFGSDKHLPNFRNETISVNNYCPEFEVGFKDACNLILNNKEKICDHIVKTKDDIHNIQTRILIRLTYRYSGVLNESFSPLHMSDYYEYNKLLEYLWRGYNEIFVPEQVVQNEIDQLTNNEIPYYFTSPFSKDLFDSQNHVLVKNYFKSTGYEFSLGRIKNLDTETIREQINIIRRSLYVHNDYDIDLKYKSDFKPLSTKSSDFFISEIGEFLYHLNSGSEKENYFSYIDYTITKDDLWSQGVQNCDMFQGIEGIGLFFTALYSEYKEKKYLVAANKIFNQSQEFLMQNQNVFLDNVKAKIGIVNFPISTFYFGLLGNRILNDNYFKIEEEVFLFFLKYIEQKYFSDNYYCYLSGSTGLILLLIEFYKLNNSPRLYTLILQLGKHLVNSAVEIENGLITWEKPFFNKWGGFAHGNSSTSYALFKLSEFSNNKIFFDTAVKALKYDQSLFDASKQVWRKSVDFEGDVHHSWGNGSAGIALSRFLISNYYSNTFLKEEINIAIKNIDKHLPEAMDSDHSVGSGLLGMVEIRKILDPSFNNKKLIDNYIQSITNLNDIKCGGWNKNPLVTGLFYGFAGIGYNLLKLTKDNKNFPSLLWL